MGNGLLTQDPVSNTPVEQEAHTSSGDRMRSMMISSTQPPESAFGLKDKHPHESEESGASLQPNEQASSRAIAMSKYAAE
jgi:hypothetical protein